MARLRFGRPISLRWNGLLLEGPASTVFEIPDEYYEEFNEDIGAVEPTLEWLDSDEGATLRGRVTALEGAGSTSLSNDAALALGTAASGTGSEASRDDHVHPTTGLALSGHNHDSAYAPLGSEGRADIVYEVCKNSSGTTIPAYSVVYINGADGTNPTIALADADSEATSSKTLGFTETSSSNGDQVTVITQGRLTGVDTSAASTEGVAVWLSSTAGGYVFGTPPAEPAHSVYLGVVTKKNVSTGEIFVKVQNGYELDELHNVSAGSPANGDVLQYNSTSGMWEKESLATAGIASTSHSHDEKLSKSLYTASMYFATGQVETLNRAYINGTSQRPQTGRTHLQFFVAPETITVGTATVWVQGTGTSITLARMGLYTWDESTGTATLVARTANDTTIAGTASTLQSRDFDTTGGYPSTYTLTAGSAYAFGFITVGTTAPQILTTAVAGDSNVSSITPRIAAVKTSQTDLQTVSGGFTNVQFSIWGRFS